MDKWPGASFLHPACAQNKTLISNTANTRISYRYHNERRLC